MTSQPHDGPGARLRRVKGRMADRLRTSRAQRQEIERLRAAQLFGAEFYLANNPDVARSGHDPLIHFAARGWREGRSPHPLFDLGYYASAHPEVVRSGRNPLADFIDGGWRQRRNPHPLFDAGYYLDSNPDVAAADLNPLTHFLSTGWREGRNPHPLFDVAHYLGAYADVARQGLNPLIHFVASGWREGRSPHPLFDPRYYLEAQPGVAAAGVNPLVHFAGTGWRERRNPHPLFDTSYYLDANPDVAGAGVDPLAHFVTVGWRQGRDPHPLFDTAYYLQANADVARLDVNPLAHFVAAGWREGRDPHPLFSTRHYLDAYPDVAAAEMNPLIHFLAFGWRVRRNPHPLFDVAYYLRADPGLAERGVNPLVHFVTEGMAAGRLPLAGFDAEMHLPLPGFAWEPGQSRVERVLRTFVRARALPLAHDEAGPFVDAISTAAAAQPRLYAPDSPGEPDVSVVIPVFNHVRLTLWCLHALLSGRHARAFEIVVVDDASDDATATVLAKLPGLLHVRNLHNRGFVHSCNLGAQHSRGRHLVFLNNDTLPQDGWLDAILDTFRDHPEAGVVGAKLVYPDGRLQEAGGIVWQNGAAWNYGRGGDRRRPEFNYLRAVDYCSGAALAVPAELFRQAGGFDEALAPGYGEDLDLAMRMRERGRAVLYQPLSEVVHVEGATGGTSLRHGAKAFQARNMERLFERWRIALRAHRPEAVEPGIEKDRDAERRVLFLDSFTPRPDQDAGSLDALRWMQALGALGYQVTFVPHRDLLHAGRYTSDLQRQGIECILEPAWTTAEQFVVAHGREFDLCVFYRYEAADELMRAVERFAPQARRLLGLCDLAHVRTERQAALSGSERDARAAREIRLRELLACARSDALWTPSRWERDHLRSELPDADVFVCPLVQDVRAPVARYAERDGIGFVGGYRHAPNVDAVLFFVREVLPHVLKDEPKMKLRVAGSAMPPEIAGITDPAVEVMGQVADLRAFFEKLRVFVAPVRFGAGVKGKVAASFGAGVPVVGTTLALEGMGLEPEEGALIADDPREIARAIVRVYRDEALWNHLSQAGLRRAQREYSTTAGTRCVAQVMDHLGVATGPARAYLERWGDVPGRPQEWPHVPGMDVDVVHTRQEYLALRASDTQARRVELEQKLLCEAVDTVALRGWSVPAQRPVVFRAAVEVDREGRRSAWWREELICPITRLNNRQRAIAALAQELLVDAACRIEDVYLTEQVTPLFTWITGRFRTVRITGSEYLGPEVPAGEVRGGIVHQDVEKLGLPDSSVDLILSCDVLEHVNEPQAALAEMSRVLRPGGRLLFTVPFSWHRAENVRRARFHAGSVEHLAEPSYHGNPMDDKGSLVYFDFGWELLDWIHEAGFREVSLFSYWSRPLGHLGSPLEALHARR